jgi:hypothetical protein
LPAASTALSALGVTAGSGAIVMVTFGDASLNGKKDASSAARAAERVAGVGGSTSGASMPTATASGSGAVPDIYRDGTDRRRTVQNRALQTLGLR